MNTFFPLQDVRQTVFYANFMKKMGWRVKKIDCCYLFFKKLPFLPFYLGKILRYSNKLNLQKLKDAVKKYRFLFIKLYPFQIHKNLVSHTKKQGKTKNSLFKKDNHPLIPTKTIFLDLEKNLEEIKKSFKQKTRYNLNLSLRKEVITKVIDGGRITNKQLKEFFDLWSQNKPYNFLFKPSLKELLSLTESFSKNCFFVFVFKHKEIIAQSLILTSKNMACYWFNASNKKGKALFAPTLVIWEAVREGKKRGLKVFDLDGIYDKRFNNQAGWQGFSRFKQGFGGKIVVFTKPLTFKTFLLNRLLPGGTKKFKRTKVTVKSGTG